MSELFGELFNLMKKSKNVKFVFVSVFLLFTLTGCAMTKIDIDKMELKIVRVDDIDIAYRSFGRGKPILLIMGFSGTMDMWQPYFLSALSARYNVIIFDSRGIGASGVTDKKFSIELFADDAAGLLDALGIKNAHILGWSMGTNVAQELALRHPEHVNKLILYAADPGGKECIQPQEPLDTVTDTSGTLAEREKRVLTVLFPEKWLKANPDFRQYFPAPKERTPVVNVNRQARAMFEWQGSFERLSQIQCPTLLITGSEDVIPPPVNSFNMAKKMPAARVVEIKGAGHGLMYQYPEEFTKAVLDFLNK